MILRGVLNNEKALPPPERGLRAFFFVAETSEISNLDLIRDIDRINKMEEILFITK